MNQLISFLRNKTKNQWIKVGNFDIYVRHGHHYIDSKVITTFDIANIENRVEAERGKGKFKLILAELQQILEIDKDLRGDIKGIFIESVLNPQLIESLPKLGFRLVGDTNPPSFFRPVAYAMVPSL